VLRIVSSNTTSHEIEMAKFTDVTKLYCIIKSRVKCTKINPQYYVTRE